MTRMRSAWLAAVLCLLPALALAEIQPNLEQELRLLQHGEKLQLHIPGAKYRIAVFTYEDPDGTELGDALAALVGRQVLLRSAGGSIGVLRYQGGLAPSASDALSYFDKVDRVANAQEVTLSVWGMVRRNGGKLTVDTYVQIPPRIVADTFVWRVRLPRRMEGELVAHLQPDRIFVQRLELQAGAAGELRAAARKLDELRAEPSDSAPVVGTLPRGSVYWIEEERGDWILANAREMRGWVRGGGHCTGACAPLLDAANFGAALIAFMASPGAKRIPDGLLPDAEAVRDQLAALEPLNRGSPAQLEVSIAPIERRLRDTASNGTVPPGGAALANVRAVGKLAILLQLEARGRAREAGARNIEAIYDDLAPDPAQVRAIAFELAEASLVDPRNADVLHNLAVLFAYAGDADRAQLARSLAAELTAR